MKLRMLPMIFCTIHICFIPPLSQTHRTFVHHHTSSFFLKAPRCPAAATAEVTTLWYSLLWLTRHTERTRFSLLVNRKEAKHNFADDLQIQKVISNRSTSEPSVLTSGCAMCRIASFHRLGMHLQLPRFSSGTSERAVARSKESLLGALIPALW